MANCKAPLFKWMTTAIFLIIAILCSIYSPHKLLLEERLSMRPGLPAFDWWKTPPDVVKLSVYLYNITNAEAFLNGEDSKFEMDQIGPIILNEIWTHKNIVFNDNGTLSYTLNKTGIYQEENNNINLNDSIVVFNFPLLMATSYLSGSSFFVKMGFNSLIRVLDTQPIVTMTIYDYLFNNSDDFLKAASSFLPSLVPYDNVGLVKLLYWNTEDNITMFIGKEHGDRRFSMIDKYNGSPYFPGYDGECKVNLTNATEFMILNQDLKTTDVFHYTRKALCRLIEVGFKETTSRYGLPAYKYQVKPSYLNRTFPEAADCYKGYPTLPNGLSDVSKCWGDLPLVASLPYFEYGDEILQTYVNFNVNTTRTLPYIIAEPFTGLPYERMASIQLNVLVRPLSGFDDRFSRFGDTVLPIGWTECSSYEFPMKMLILLYIFYAVYYLQIPFICVLLYFGFRVVWTDVIFIKTRNILKRIIKGKAEKNRLDAVEMDITKDEIERDTLLRLNNN